MEIFKNILTLTLAFSMFVLMPASSFANHNERNACNPCAKNMGNACNPCGKKMKNACNPCGKSMKNACNPCNPCANKPPKPIRGTHMSDYSKLAAMGKRLWNDESLGESGMSCMGCHDDYENFNSDTVAKPYPHFVNMPKDIVTLDQMINFCILNPVDGKMINSNSLRMTAMAAFFQEYIKSYEKPQNACNPCNPCGKRRK